MKRITLWLNGIVFKELKLLAMTEDLTIGQMVEELLKAYKKQQEVKEDV